jgi:hypothetical protein
MNQCILEGVITARDNNGKWITLYNEKSKCGFMVYLSGNQQAIAHCGYTVRVVGKMGIDENAEFCIFAEFLESITK